VHIFVVPDPFFLDPPAHTHKKDVDVGVADLLRYPGFFGFVEVTGMEAAYVQPRIAACDLGYRSLDDVRPGPKQIDVVTLTLSKLQQSARELDAWDTVFNTRAQHSGSPNDAHAVCHDQICVLDDGQEFGVSKRTRCHLAIQGDNQVWTSAPDETVSNLKKLTDIIVAKKSMVSTCLRGDRSTIQMNRGSRRMRGSRFGSRTNL
jgi:hypothetical protein